ncbi:CAP domain-containing protein [Candidatus Haliotispira prima]|uniref:CAP domain-containing protein n=1 Tax=Candidatus Haliotispira prima TaxID=3034016 RepID=A0ABY8MIC1_9SPIO|nr:CAP domain-containing protein [Candidatus Haliotispira prima]
MKKIFLISLSIIGLLSLQAYKTTEQLFANSPASGPGLAKRMSRDGWDVSKLDTARDLAYLGQDEKDVILAQNAVRSNPRKFAELYVREVQSYYSGSLLEYPGEIRIQTREGRRAADELYRELQRQKPLPLLQPSRGMSQAAADHGADQARSGDTGHRGRDGSQPFDRINRHGKWGKTAGENISYGDGTGLRIILQLMIDDGVASRGHRVNILNKDFRIVGVAIDRHPQYGHSCTITYAGSYRERS